MSVKKKETKKKKNKETYLYFEGNTLATKGTLLVYKIVPRGNLSVEATLLGVNDETTGGNFIVKHKDCAPTSWPTVEIFKTLHHGWSIKEITKVEAFTILL